MTRILFYLPNITPWWFDHMVAPLIRALAGETDVHVMVPPLWRSTGITGDQLAPFMDGPDIQWHILDEIDPLTLRTAGSRDAALGARIHAIEADITICRCADPDVVDAFPGTVRYIMEGASHPIANGGCPVTFPTQLFEHGAMPTLSEADATALDEGFAGIWAYFEAEVRHRDVPSWRLAAGISPDRPVVAVPLEYDFEDSFTAGHQHYATNIDLIDEAAAEFGEDVFLAFTNHPLNDLYGDTAGVEARIAALGDRAAMIRSSFADIRATELVARDCDGAVVDLTKSYLAYAYFGVPFVRPTRLPTADWLNAARDVGGFAAALKAGTATPAPADATRLWFAHHIADAALDVSNRRLTADWVLDHLRQPLNPSRWAANLDQFARQLRRHTAVKRRLAA